MYIDKYFIKVIGEEYDEKKEKHIPDVTKVTIGSSDGIHHKKFIPLMEEIMDAHDGCTVEFDIIVKQHEYK